MTRRARRTHPRVDRDPLRLAAFVAGVALLLWGVLRRDPAAQARDACRERYARAHSARDTALVDRSAAGGGRAGPWNCGLVRASERR